MRQVEVQIQRDHIDKKLKDIENEQLRCQLFLKQKKKGGDTRSSSEARHMTSEANLGVLGYKEWEGCMIAVVGQINARRKEYEAVEHAAEKEKKKITQQCTKEAKAAAKAAQAWLKEMGALAKEVERQTKVKQHKASSALKTPRRAALRKSQVFPVTPARTKRPQRKTQPASASEDDFSDTDSDGSANGDPIPVCLALFISSFYSLMHLNRFLILFLLPLRTAMHCDAGKTINNSISGQPLSAWDSP